MCFLKLKKSEHFLIYMVPVIPFLFGKKNVFPFRNDRSETISCRDLLPLIHSRKKKVPDLSHGRLLYTGSFHKCRIVPHTVSACFRMLRNDSNGKHFSVLHFCRCKNCIFLLNPHKKDIPPEIRPGKNHSVFGLTKDLLLLRS